MSKKKAKLGTSTATTTTTTTTTTTPTETIITGDSEALSFHDACTKLMMEHWKVSYHHYYYYYYYYQYHHYQYHYYQYHHYYYHHHHHHYNHIIINYYYNNHHFHPYPFQPISPDAQQFQPFFPTTEFPTFNQEFISENGTPLQTFMGFFRSKIRNAAFQILKNCTQMRKTSSKSFSFDPNPVHIVHWIGCHLFMENTATAFGNHQFRENFNYASKLALKDNISFPSLNCIEILRSTFIPSTKELDYFEELVTEICSSNVAMKLVHHIAVDESILEAFARIDNQKRSDVSKEQPQNSNGNVWEKHQARLLNVPIVEIPGKEHKGLQSISAAIKIRVKSQRSFHNEIADYQNTVKRGYFIGIKFLKHDPVTWEEVYAYYARKFQVHQNPKHVISDSRFSSERLFKSASQCGWKVTLSMKSTIPTHLWKVTDFLTSKDHSLALRNDEVGAIASCFHDGDNFFHLWTNYFSTHTVEKWDESDISALQLLPESALAKLVEKQDMIPAADKNELIYQLTGYHVTPTETQTTQTPISITQQWPSSVDKTLEELQLYSSTQLQRYLSKNVTAATIKEVVSYFSLPQLRKKQENIEQLLPIILPSSATLSRQQRLDNFISNLKASTFPGKLIVHDAYGNNFNSVDLADKIWYYGGKPQFMSNHWTQRLFFYIIRILVNNAWVLYELWHVMDLGTFRIEIAKGLLKMSEDELSTWI